MKKFTGYVQTKYQDLKMATKPEGASPPDDAEPSLPRPLDIDLEAKGRELGIRYFLISYTPLNTDTRVSVVPLKSIREVQQNGCGTPAAMFFKADAADPEMYLLPDPKTLIQLPWKPEYGWLSRQVVLLSMLSVVHSLILPHI
jgi:glutamine synthetase